MYGEGFGLCVLRMLDIFSGGRGPEVEGDNSRVVVTVGKRETAYFKIYFKRWHRRWRKLVNAVTPYKNCVLATGASMAYIQ